MPGLEAARSGRIEAAFLQTAARRHRAALRLRRAPCGADRAGALLAGIHASVSELRLSLRVRPKGLLSGLQGPRTVHLDIVDYPGEWLLDLGLLDQDFADWSRTALARAEARGEAAAYLAALEGLDPAARLEETTASAAGANVDRLPDGGRGTRAIRTARRGGSCLPGDLEGSPR